MNAYSQRLLSAIDGVPWSKIEHAFGPATDIPDLIRALASTDAKARSDAWSKLHGNIWHQGTIYEATSYMVPIFLALLQEPMTPSKHEIVAFLALLFTGRSYWDVHQHVPILQAEIREPDFQQKLERELGWVKATKEAVSDGREAYRKLLEQGDPGTKIAAAYQLGLIGATDFDTLEEIIRAAER